SWKTTFTSDLGLLKAWTRPGSRSWPRLPTGDKLTCCICPSRRREAIRRAQSRRTCCVNRNAGCGSCPDTYSPALELRNSSASCRHVAPIDLWLNLQFSQLDVLVTQRPIIEQRPDVPSTNSYSVLPVLSQIGVL